MNKQSMVTEFMLATGRQYVPQKPEIPDKTSRELRVKLMLEEVLEFAHASGVAVSLWAYDLNLEGVKVYCTREPDLEKVADAIADELYVTYGAAVSWGIKIDPVFGEVHRANMTKFGPGGHAREDGKWQKPPDWTPPRIREVLEAQMD